MFLEINFFSYEIEILIFSCIKEVDFGFGFV